MPFPAIERVIYQKNPLIEVVFQARVPKYLPIETETPSDFQKLVVREYPIYEQRQVLQIVLAPFPQDVRSSENAGRIHAFVSSDRIWTISLSGDGVVLAASKYVRWEEFKDRLRTALDAFLSVYPLPIFTRIGLRYQNIISRETLGLKDRQWHHLLKPYIVGEIGPGAIDEAQVSARQTLATVGLNDGDALLLRHGLIKRIANEEVAYLIDGDFYNEAQRKADLNGTLEVAERLHTNSGRLFRWCISDELHAKMDPEPAD
jgi:uncharacterized protein (TIGR04255 family)